MRVGSQIARWLDECVAVDDKGFLSKAVFVCLFLMAISAPHSIFATQLFWILGTLIFIAKLVVGYFQEEKLEIRLPVPAIAMIALFVWTFVTALMSYAPDISLKKMNTASLVLIFLLFVNAIRTKKAVASIVFALVISTMVNVFWMPLERIPGRGVAISGIKSESPLRDLQVQEGDTFLEVNDVKVGSGAELIAQIQSSEKARIRYYRPDYYEFIELDSASLLKGESPEARLGVSSTYRSRNWRSAGFYGHYATYAEVLQLVGALVFGLALAAIWSAFGGRREFRLTQIHTKIDRRSLLLLIAMIFIGFALLLTATRASQAALLIACAVIAALSFGKRAVIAMVIIAIPIVIGGAFFLQKARNTTYVDQSDNSTTWRQTVYREGFELWTGNARNFVFGVGMDSIKRFAPEWKLFDNGRLPAGHFHSNPIQLVVERGLPALLIYLWLFGGFFFGMFRFLKAARTLEWWEFGTLTGTFGGAIGFQMSGLVHYNFGDSEVVMVLFVLMGLSTVVLNGYFGGASE